MERPRGLKCGKWAAPQGRVCSAEWFKTYIPIYRLYGTVQVYI